MLRDRGRKGFRLPSLRTVQAGLPHTALQSVVTPSGLTEQVMDCGISEQSLTCKMACNTILFPDRLSI